MQKHFAASSSGIVNVGYLQIPNSIPYTPSAVHAMPVPHPKNVRNLRVHFLRRVKFPACAVYMFSPNRILCFVNNNL
jgi:hypothetical protein